MSTFKTTNGDYTINLGPYANSQWNGTLTVNGNLNVSGNISTIDDLFVTYPFIVVAANNTGTVHSMGIVAQKTTDTFAGLRYNTITSEWEISSSVYANGDPVGSSYVPIAGFSYVAGSDTQIQFNQDNNFGASPALAFDYTNNFLTVQGAEVFGNIGDTPSYSGNGVAVYNKNIGSGGTGLYVKSSSVNDELVSRTKAIVYAIIF